MPRKEGKWNVGIEYQLKIIAYAAFCLSQNEEVEDFEIYTNEDDVPGFDDIIIKVKYKSEQKPFVYLGQVKHVRTKINFKGKKHSLNDYLRFMVQIIHEKDQNPFLKQLFQDVPEENIEFWYISNSFLLNPSQSVMLDDDIVCYIEPDTTNKSIFPVKNTSDYYKLNPSNIDQNSHVFSKFRFILNQPDYNKISRCIVDLNADTISIETASAIIQYVHDYLKIPTNRKITKHVFETELLRLCLCTFVVPLTTAIEIDTQLAYRWNSLTMEHNVTIVENTSEQMKSYIFGCLWQRIKELFGCSFDWNKCITNFKGMLKVIDNNKFLELTKGKTMRYWLFIPDTINALLFEMWKCDYLPLILSSDTKTSILKKYKHLNKSFVVLDIKARIYSEVSGSGLKIFANVADIHELQLGQEFLKEILISLQGREPVTVFSIVNGDIDLMEELKCNQLLQFIKERRYFSKKQAAIDTISKDIRVNQNIVKYKSSEVDIYTANNLQTSNERLESSKAPNLKHSVHNEAENDLFFQYNRLVPVIGRRFESCENYITRYLRKATLDPSIFDSKYKIICILTGHIDSVHSFKQKRIEIIRTSIVQVQSIIDTKLGKGGNAIVAVGDEDAEELWSKLYPTDHPLLHVQIENGIMTLLKYKNCPNLSAHISYEGSIFSEASFFEEPSSGITVITGEPGSGKSTLLHSLFNTCNKHDYVLFCDLNDYRKDLSECNAKMFENPLKFILNKESKETLSSHQDEYLKFLEKLLEKTSEPILFLDSFDEILPLCKEQVLDFIKALNKSNVRLVIASRLIMTDILIKHLNVKPVKIETLNEKDIKKYINLENLSEDQFIQYPPELQANPMYLNFLITLCKENCLPDNVTRFTLYNAIIDKHIKRYYDKKSHKFTQTQYKYLRKDIIDVHKLLALSEVFGNHMIESLSLHYKELMEYCINTDKVKLGLITRFNVTRPVFAHRTFAEFLVAEWLSENFDRDYVKDIYKMLFHDGKEYIRRLLDDILCESLTLHKAILSEDLTVVENICSECCDCLKQIDKLDRTPLHLASAYCSSFRSKKQNYLILETILVHMNKNAVCMDGRDLILNWTWLDYLKLNEEFFKKSCTFGLVNSLEKHLAYEERTIEGKDIIDCLENHNLAAAMVLLRRNISLLPIYFYFFVIMAVDLRCLSVLGELIELQNYNNMKFNILSKASRSLSLTSGIANCSELVVHGGFTALHIACIYGNINVIKELLHIGVKTDTLDNFQLEALYYAIIQGSVDIVTLLVQYKSKGKKRNVLKNTLSKLVSELIPLAPFEWTFLVNLNNNIYQPHLHISVKKDYVKIIEILLENGFDVNQKNRYGETALHIATEEINMDIIKVLLAHDANINARNNTGDNVLHIVARNKYAVDRNRKVSLGNNTKNESAELMKMLLKHHHTKIDVQNSSGDTALHIATRNNRPDIVEVLLQHGAKTDLKNKDYNTPLHIATRNKYDKIIKLLLEHGAYCIKDRDGNTPLDIAAKNCDDGTIKLLLKILLKHRESNDFEVGAALHTVARYGNVHAVRVLLDNGININATDSDGASALHVAVRNHRVGVVQELLKRSIDVEHRNENGDTAIHVATREEDAELVEILLKHDANTSRKDKDGSTILHIATKKKNAAIVKLILGYSGGSHHTDHNNNIALHIAAGNRSIDIIKMLLEYGANINYRDEYGKTALDVSYENEHFEIVEVLSKYLENNPIERRDVEKTNLQDLCASLHVATSNGEVNIVEALLERRLSCNRKNPSGDTPLHIASKSGNREIVHVLLGNGANYNLKDAHGYTALQLAVNNKDADVVKLLLEYGADSNCADESGNPCLHACVQSGDLHVLNLLLKHGVNVDHRDSNGNTALHIFANISDNTGNSMDVISLLLENALNINHQNDDGDTPLHVAARNENLSIVIMLLKNSANMNLKNNHGQTALHMVLGEKKSTEIITALLENGASVGCKDHHGNTVLHIATMNNNPNVVKLLLKTGVNLNYINNSGDTALHIATENNDANLVQILSDNGADVNVQNKDGDTALFVAIRRRSVKVVLILLNSGADVNIRNGIGDNALHAAAKTESKDIVKMLLDRGANVNSVNKEGQIAVYIATRYKNKSVVKMLVEYGGDCLRKKLG